MNDCSRLCLTAAFALLLAACGAPGPREPAWRGAASGALNDYVRLRLEGHDAAAARAYNSAIERMRDGGDLHGLHTVALARCAMDTALLKRGECSNFSQRAAEARAEALAYHEWLRGTLPAARVAELPERYRAFAATIAGAQAPAVTAALRAIADPVSRMVATGVAQQARLLETTALAESAQIARTQGWRAAHRAYEQALAQALESAGQHEAAAAVRARLRALFADEPAGKPP
jgi:hypothetical protein